MKTAVGWQEGRGRGTTVLNEWREGGGRTIGAAQP